MTIKEKAMRTEVKPQPKRRYLSKAYKLKILHEYDSCTKLGEKGEILRREGLYSSTITDWRRHLLNDNLENQQRHILEVENQRLKRELEITQKVIEVQKKILEISELGIKQK